MIKGLIKRWLGIEEKEPVILIKIDHPDSLEQDITPDMQRAIAGFFKLSLPGRVLMSNLVEDGHELDREATVATGDRDYLCGKAAGHRETLAKILKLCIVKEETPKGDANTTNNDGLSAALGREYEIREER